MIYSFVSGATGGIGKAFSIELAKTGNNLFLTGRSEEKLIKLKEELSIYGVEIEVFACNLVNDNERLSMLSFIKERQMTFNKIINVAGVDIQKAFLDYTYEKVLMQIRVNVESTISLTYALLKLREPSTEIVTVSSMSGVTPMPYFALYSATKSMLTSFFMALRLELKGEGVKITTVLPGGVPTREDIILDIKNQGIWGKLSSKSPKFVAKKSLSKVKKNKAKYIPGFFNKLLNFLMKLVPVKLQMIFIKNRWKKQSKDAF